MFTKSLDEDKNAMIDLWEDIGPWTNSTKSRPVRFTYIEVDNDAKLLQIFKENKKKESVEDKRVQHGRGKTLEIIHGSSSESYKLVPKLREELLKANPGSVVQYELDVDHSFQRLFVCIEACRMGFIKGCRPFPGLDGCHLKGKHKGIMLSATSIDANNCLFPVAFAIVESECGDSWRWFMENLYNSIGEALGLAFMLTKTKSQFTPNARSGYVTNNISESFNAWINKARQMPIVEMVEIIRHKIMERIDHRRALGRKWRGKLVPKALKYIQTIIKDIGEYIVRRSSDVIAKVVGPDLTTVVRLDERTCTCRA
ncbi:hypothetical protein QJS10_CPB11g01190 [Acorus calamus]|uniref:MULE transposase domain-containing protein n=1 Tax=Acorus calamus TaxID=4465 RepID=A0AAV9DUB7_ACOCL|nr:hypothetical protein QJS10_CPB11g01190 [Acorus calamus]